MDYSRIKLENQELNRQEILQGAVRLKSRPLVFWFDLTGSCNIECKHCGFQVHGRTSEQEASERVYQTVMEELMPYARVCNLGGTNYGEMTISKHFDRFIADCKKYQVKVNLTTNGTRMADEWFTDLLHSLTVIGFSMEGMEEQFENMRGFKWRFFLKNVERVAQGRSAMNLDFRIEWRFCAHSENIMQLPEMIRLAHRIGVDRIQVMNLIAFVPSQKFKNLYFHRSLANHWFSEARRVAEELNFNISIPPDFDTGTFNGTLVQLNALPVTGTQKPFDGLDMVACYRPWQACSINELGDVRPCCVYWRGMGSLAKSSFDAVWNGRKYRKLRQSINTQKSDPICYSCRRPKFDSDDGLNNMQERPGLREIAKSLLRTRRRAIRFDDVLDPEYDPRQEPAPTGLQPENNVPVGVVENVSSGT